MNRSNPRIKTAIPHLGVVWIQTSVPRLTTNSVASHLIFTEGILTFIKFHLVLIHAAQQNAYGQISAMLRYQGLTLMCTQNELWPSDITMSALSLPHWV